MTNRLLKNAASFGGTNHNKEKIESSNTYDATKDTS
jgi:hypothetical protein